MNHLSKVNSESITYSKGHEISIASAETIASQINECYFHEFIAPLG